MMTSFFSAPSCVRRKRPESQRRQLPRLLRSASEAAADWGRSHSPGRARRSTGACLAAPGSGGRVQTPSAELATARCRATDNTLHQRRAQPWAAAAEARKGGGARWTRSRSRVRFPAGTPDENMSIAWGGTGLLRGGLALGYAATHFFLFCSNSAQAGGAKSKSGAYRADCRWPTGVAGQRQGSRRPHVPRRGRAVSSWRRARRAAQPEAAGRNASCART